MRALQQPACAPYRARDRRRHEDAWLPAGQRLDHLPLPERHEDCTELQGCDPARRGGVPDLFRAWHDGELFNGHARWCDHRLRASCRLHPLLLDRALEAQDMNWVDEVASKLKRGNSILFTKDSSILQDLR